jgi:cytidylate kinase
MRSLENIVSEQVERWRIERERNQRASVTPEPVIAVAREYGARGAAVAHAVAERLGFTYWNHELVDEIARTTRVSATLVESLDEHHDPSLLTTFRGLVGHRLGQAEYFDRLVRIVHTIASHGRAILIGRGIGFMLPPARVYRVQVVSPLAERIAGLVERRGLDEAAAAAEVAAVDAERTAFVRDHFPDAVEVPSAFDLVVNTGSYGVERAAELVTAGYRLRFPTSG